MKIVKYLLWCIMGVLPRGDHVELTDPEFAIGIGIFVCGGILWLIIGDILGKTNNELSITSKQIYASFITIFIGLILCGLLIIFEPWIEPYIIPYISELIYS